MNDNAGCLTTAVIVGKRESYATDSVGNRYAVLGVGSTAKEAMNDAFDMTDSPVIVTRHTGLVEWLRQRGIMGEVIAHATPENVDGRDVVGALPLHLAALAESVTTVDMPNLRPDQRGQDLTPEEMDAAGASLARYTVRRVV